MNLCAQELYYQPQSPADNFPMSGAPRMGSLHLSNEGAALSVPWMQPSVLQGPPEAEKDCISTAFQHRDMLSNKVGCMALCMDHAPSIKDVKQVIAP